jgi:Ca2+-binding RTX toxin-like protein
MPAHSCGSPEPRSRSRRSWGALDTVAGRSLHIASDTVIKFAWAGDGNDIIIANNFGDTIQAGRGNDTIVAGRGADILYGGPGSDNFVYNFLAQSADSIRDFTVGNDVIDLHQMFASIGYTGMIRWPTIG